MFIVYGIQIVMQAIMIQNEVIAIDENVKRARNQSRSQKLRVQTPAMHVKASDGDGRDSSHSCPSITLD